LVEVFVDEKVKKFGEPNTELCFSRLQVFSNLRIAKTSAMSNGRKTGKCLSG